MSEVSQFAQERAERVEEFGKDSPFKELALSWVEASMKRKYIYNFDWMGRPIIQYPEDIMAVQELIWELKPDVVVETGIAHGGSLILSASMLALLDYCEAVESGSMLDPSKREYVTPSAVTRATSPSSRNTTRSVCETIAGRSLATNDSPSP